MKPELDEELFGFSRGLFRKRRERVLDALGKGAMVLPAAPVLLKGRDTELPYRQDSDLFYLTGFTEADCVLVLRGFADSSRAVLFTLARDPKAERWSGPRLGPAAAPAALGIDEARAADKLDAELGPLLAGADRVFYRLGADPRIERPVLEALRMARTMGARHGVGPQGIMDPGVILNELRLRKDVEEVDAIREATAITVQGFLAALSRLGPQMGEWEIEAELEATFRRFGAQGPAFPSIVGAGENACVLHYVKNGARVGKGDLVLVDAGAELHMYGGDVTRTVPASGRFSAEQRELYQIVEDARREAVAAIRPGARLDEVHRTAVTVLVSGLRNLGVLEGEVEGLIESGAHEPYFPHRTSHWLGLDTHDVGDYAKNGTSRHLEPGMVLTVEPGLYFPAGNGGGRFEGIGIRIEDDVVVTHEGCEVLSADLPTRPEEIETLVAGELGGEGA
jgi:Xaa-Pro aminopeptidase